MFGEIIFFGWVGFEFLFLSVFSFCSILNNFQTCGVRILFDNRVVDCFDAGHFLFYLSQ